MISDNRLKTWKAVADESAQDISYWEKWTTSTIWKFYFQNISWIFPYYETGQNYGNRIFQPFSTIFPKQFHTMKEVLFCQCHSLLWTPGMLGDTKKNVNYSAIGLWFSTFSSVPPTFRVWSNKTVTVFLLNTENARKPFSSKDMVTVFCSVLFFNKIIDIWRAGIRQQHIPMFLNSLINIFANLTCWVL